MSKQIAIAAASFAEFNQYPIKLLKNNGFQIKFNKSGRKLRGKEISDICKGCSGVIAGTEVYDFTVLGSLPELEVISRCGSGIENIDMKTAHNLGIAVLNTPHAPVEAVSELSLGLILSACRKINLSDKLMKESRWERLPGELVSGKTIGIVGFGRIGARLAQLLEPFSVSILAYDIRNNLGICKKTSLKRVTLKEVLKRSDIISIHLPLTDETRGLIGEKEFALMKSGVILVNTARGEIIDHRSLTKFLSSGKPVFACLDVFDREPYKGKLLGFENTILTPHIGSYTRQTRSLMEREAVENLINVFKGVI